MNLHKWMLHMLWFDCTASPADLHSLVLRRNTVLSVPVIGHRCTVNLPSQKKMEMFIFKYKGCLRFTGQQRNEAENVPAGPLKTPRIRVVHKHWFLTCWCHALGSGGGSDHLYSFYDLENREGLIFAEWQVVVLSFSFGFFLFHCTFKDEMIHICWCTKSFLECSQFLWMYACQIKSLNCFLFVVVTPQPCRGTVGTEVLDW